MSQHFIACARGQHIDLYTIRQRAKPPRNPTKPGRGAREIAVHNWDDGFAVKHTQTSAFDHKYPRSNLVARSPPGGRYPMYLLQSALLFRAPWTLKVKRTDVFHVLPAVSGPCPPRQNAKNLLPRFDLLPAEQTSPSQFMVKEKASGTRDESESVLFYLTERGRGICIPPLVEWETLMR